MSEGKTVLKRSRDSIAIAVRQAQQFVLGYPISPEERAKLGPLSHDARGSWKRPAKELPSDISAEGGALGGTPTLVSE